MTSSQTGPSQALIQHMAAINRLNLKAFSAKNKQALIFIILNDTIQAARYDRAVLWGMQGNKPRILGVSGQTAVNKDAQLTKQWQALAEGLTTPNKAGLLNASSFNTEAEPTWRQFHEQTNSQVIWLPIFSDEELVLGLWLESFGKPAEGEIVDESIKFLSNYLTPAYGSAWKKLTPSFKLQEKGITKQQIAIVLAGFLLFLFIVRVPLRVVAPCEIVANDPFFVTAPLEGIVEEVKVNPGENVKKGDILFEYDKRIPLRNLKVAQKEVEVLEAEVNRGRTLGLDDKKSRTELGIQQLKLEKGKIDLNYALWQSTQLTQKSKEDGVVMLDNPDAWRGKPVKVGERILSINDPKDTKVRIWIPEDDNIVLDEEKPIRVVLNINPSKSYDAKLLYIANESMISTASVPSFVAEANWVRQPDDIKLGLKGTAILYGQKVSLFYFIIRKPWGALRHYLGM